MGISDRNNESFGFQYVEKELNVIENYLDDNKREVKGPATPRSRRRRFIPLCHVNDTGSRRQRLGVRQARRCENLNHLMEMAELEEIDPHDLECVELVEPGLSVFAELFAESEKMKIWNDFVNCSEDEQQTILAGMADEGCGDGEECGLDRQDSWEEIGDDKRTVHPAYTAEECYKRIDQNLRTFLRKKQLPLGTLEHLEDELVNFFHEWPVSVYVSKIESSFERMLLHALCQYLDLSSHSFNDSDGVRQTQIENNNVHFAPPQHLLSHFLVNKDYGLNMTDDAA